jgi:hypothetical protein
MSLDSAITCCGRSWGSECQICEEKAYQDYLKTIEDNDGGDSDGITRKD